MRDSSKTYIEYVQNAIKKFGKLGDLIHNNQVLPEDINRSLAEYMNLSLALNAEYQIAKLDHLDIEENFKRWYDKKFDETKARVIQEYQDNGTVTKPNLKEIETRLRNYYRTDYDAYQEKLKITNSKVRFLLRVLETYKRFDNILTNLSQNMRTELRALSLNDRINATSEGGSSSDKVRTNFPVRPRIRENY